jgi:hypothetical protein
MAFLDDLVGPISNEYCLYFYIFAVVEIAFFFLLLIGIVYTGMKKKLGIEFYFLSIIYSFGFLLSYLKNRLLFNMCKASV